MCEGSVRGAGEKQHANAAAGRAVVLLAATQTATSAYGIGAQQPLPQQASTVPWRKVLDVNYCLALHASWTCRLRACSSYHIASEKTSSLSRSSTQIWTIGSWTRCAEWMAHWWTGQPVAATTEGLYLLTITTVAYMLHYVIMPLSSCHFYVFLLISFILQSIFSDGVFCMTLT